ncbi:MAG TPA: NUDIX domain-containing protein [Thermoplasmatales archaeon]|nr:NUDIX domain-containing protein [Thermoplasmatales archaeon]
MIEVVTAILKKDKKILILKRGNKVRTYKGKWAGISGYIEENEEPLERVIKEIEEETGLKRSEIFFVKKIKPVQFFDENENIQWKVHPFLFEVKKDEIKIDWEHIDYKWINVEEIDEYDTVPKLKETIHLLMKSSGQ